LKGELQPPTSLAASIRSGFEGCGPVSIADEGR
jgi:hypothetical protein